MREAIPAELPEGERMDVLWETYYKPKVLGYKRVPLDLVGEIMGRSKDVVMEMLRSGGYPFGESRQCKYETRFEIFPLRSIAWYEGRM